MRSGDATDGKFGKGWLAKALLSEAIVVASERLPALFRRPQARRGQPILQGRRPLSKLGFSQQLAADFRRIRLFGILARRRGDRQKALAQRAGRSSSISDTNHGCRITRGSKQDNAISSGRVPTRSVLRRLGIMAAPFVASAIDSRFSISTCFRISKRFRTYEDVVARSGS